MLKDLQEKNWDELLNIKQLRMYANELRERGGRDRETKREGGVQWE